MQPTEVGSRLFFTRPERERDTGRSAVVSAAFHLAIILSLIVATRASVMLVTGDQGVGTGIGTGAAGGGGGGGQDDILNIVFASAEPEPPAAEDLVVPVKIEPVPEPPKEEEKPVEDVKVAAADSVPAAAPAPAPAPNPPGGTGTGEGTGTGAGAGPGTGPGSGGGTGGGSGGGIGSGIGPGTGRGRILGPSPEVLLIPPTAPKQLRGRSAVLRLQVDSTGIVRDAEILPPTGNRKYDDTLKKTALGWKFRPARDATNRPVAVLYDVTVTF